MVSKVLRVTSLILFVLAVFNVVLPFNPIAAGLGFWVGSTLV